MKNNIKLITIVGIVVSLIGYFYLLYEGYTLNEEVNTLSKEVKYQETRRDSLKIENNELEKLVEYNKKKIREQDSIIVATVSKPGKSKFEMAVGNQLIKELGISDKSFTADSKKSRNVNNAKKFEEEGFQFLIDKEVDSAIASFIKSENSYNGYHQVYEIAKYLRKNENKLSDKNSKFWITAYKTILSDFSYKLPPEYKQELEELSKQTTKTISTLKRN